MLPTAAWGGRNGASERAAKTGFQTERRRRAEASIAWRWVLPPSGRDPVDAAPFQVFGTWYLRRSAKL
jgi:hypothetical protein